MARRGRKRRPELEGAYWELLQAVRQIACAPQRERDDAELTEAMLAVHDECDCTYGTPRVHAESADQGRRDGRKHIARLMRAPKSTTQRDAH